MKMTGRTGWSVVGGLALAASVALAQNAGGAPRMRPGGPGHGRCGDRLVRALDLTAEQQTTLDALRDEMAETVRPLAEQLHALHGQIEDAAAGESPDACAIGGLVVQGRGLRSQIDTARKTVEARFVATLSADQKAKYDSFVAIQPGCTAVGGGFLPPPPTRD